MPSIARRVRLAVQTQLADATAGFNANFNAALTSYSLNPALIAWNTSTGIVWTSPSRNFLYGRINPAAIDAAGTLEYPIMTLDTGAVTTATTRRVISATFSGTIQALCEFHLSWDISDTLFDFSSYADAAEDAMYATINNLEQPLQNRAPNILFSGRITEERQPIVQGGMGWRQTQTFRMELEVHTI